MTDPNHQKILDKVDASRDQASLQLFDERPNGLTRRLANSGTPFSANKATKKFSDPKEMCVH